MRAFSRIFCMILLSTAWVLPNALATSARAESGRLTLTGVGIVQAEPDMASLQLGVATEARTAAEALDENSAATGEILTLLSEIGIEREDIQTSNLSLQPLWDSRSSGSPSRLVGYRVDNTVGLTVRSLGDLGVILDDLVASGANQLYGLSFGVQEPGPLEDDARRAAIKEAQRKAAIYAEAAGVTLGALLSISEPGAARSAPVDMPMIEMARSAVPVAAGSVDIQAEVVLVYAISQ